MRRPAAARISCFKCSRSRAQIANSGGMSTSNGEKVRKTQKPVTVGHMNAHDRRIIHMAMQDDETLTTKSRGEGEYRKIVILPARRGPDRVDA